MLKFIVSLIFDFDAAKVEIEEDITSKVVSDIEDTIKSIFPF